MKNLYAVMLIVIILAGAVYSQPDPTQEPSAPQKRADIAIAEVVAVNVAVWAWGHYVLDGYWTQIGWESFDVNLRHGFEWDPNKFKTNFFDHPFHGSIYFNAARTNGMNFWESAPFSFFGSLTWELFMESEYPSFNDLAMTTLGGIALGEGLYRFSEQILDDRAGGWDRAWREVAGLAINPVGGFNRLVKGDMFRRRAAINHLRNPLIGYVAVGGRGRVSGDNLEKQEFTPGFQFSLRYGDPFEEQSSRSPFDYFTFRYWTSKKDTLRHTTILEQAVLLGKNFRSGKNQDQVHLLGLFQYYDYVNAELMNFGGVTFGPGLLSQFPLGKNYQLVTGPHLGALVLGGSNNEYVVSSQGRNYNFGTGVKGKFNATLQHSKFGALLLEYNYFWIHTIEGAPGSEQIHMLDGTYNLPIWKNFGLGLEVFYYHRNGQYDYFPDVKRDIKGSRALLTYAFY